ncbi:MAG: chemotaxis protein CheB [Chitinophagaceae bacterium]
MTKTLSDYRNTKKSKSFPIVAIGASAGGLEALKNLLKNLPPDTGMAFVYIQHLDPTYKSMLANILEKVTSMPVLQATHLMPIRPNHLFIIPPNKDMGILDGHLTLNPRKPKPIIHMPVDKFFSSLAEKQQEGAIGIVLSGTASDGTLGLKAIKAAGGLTFAQDDSAKFENMPKSAVSEGVVDLVLSPGEMAKELERISRQTILQEVLNDPWEEEGGNNHEDLVNIVQMLKKATSVDFIHYKMSTIKRRIIRRMVLYKLSTFKEYEEVLRQNSQELTLLYQDLLIHVTSFFRDPDSVEYLKKRLIPKICKNKPPNEPVRIWVPACATGEEAYSLAIMVTEALGDKASNTPVQIFATDLSERAITKARLGIYSLNELSNVPPKTLQRFFTKVDGHYRIAKFIRDVCVFAPHNIIKDPPFSRLDLVSCCNLLIYLDTSLQKKILSTLHYSLNNEGYLVLGKSETLGSCASLFFQLEKKCKVFAKKKDAGTKVTFEMNSRFPEPEKTNIENVSRPHKKDNENVVDVDKLVDNILLTRFVPPSVVVNQDLEIIQFRGATGFFLEHPPGKASFNLIKMARPGLAYELRSIIHKLNKSRQPIIKRGLEIKNKAGNLRVCVEAVHLSSQGEEKLFLIIVEEEKAPEPNEVTPGLTKDRLVKRLQDELVTVKEDLRSFIEEQEATREELQSANEEIISSNEELQSVNEELETSKQEVESTNEELMTINNELLVKNEQLAESYEYSEAIIGTIREAVMVMDRNFKIMSANKTFYEMFRVKQDETERQRLFDLDNKQWNIPGLKEFLDELLLNGTQFYGFEVAHHFPGIGEKVLMLNAKVIVQQVPGQKLILLAIEDITEHRMAERVIAEREAWFRNMADGAPVMIWVSSVDKLRNFFNRTFLEFTGRQIDQEKGNGWKENIHADDLDRVDIEYKYNFDQRRPFNLEYRLRRSSGEYRWVLDVGKPAYSTEGVFTGYLGSCTEIHETKIINEELERRVEQRTRDLQQTNKELQRSNNELEQFAYVASHDLKEPLRRINTYTDRIMNKTDALPSSVGSYLEKIESSSKRMLRLIDDLLNFSRTSRMDNKFFETDLQLLVKEVLVDFELVISQKKARVRCGPLPVIQAIPLQMIQLFHNLISNALKFSKPATPPVIEIVCRPYTPDGDHVQGNFDTSLNYHEIIIKDNGLGFNPEYSQQIFIIFRRLNNNRLQFPGTGIGLALCRKIVNNHGGEIFAVSAENEGSVFHILLPVQTKHL